MTDRPHHRFRKHLREWFRLLWEVGLISEQEFNAACENELAEELEENPEDPWSLGSRSCCRSLSWGS